MNNNLKPKQIKKKFNVEEDNLLKLLVQYFGINNWKTISKQLKNRTSRQCKERWFTYLSKEINLKEWTESEDKLLINLVEQYGHKWKHFKNFFNNRTETNIKNRWTVIFRKTNKYYNENKNLFNIEILDDLNDKDYNLF